MKTQSLIFMAGFVALFFFAGCYPTDSVSYSDLDLVTTVFDEDQNFEELKTYTMPDSVIHLKDTIDNSNNVDLSRDLDPFILDLVRTNMTEYGFVAEDDPENNPPDVIVTVSAMATKNYSVYYYYPYYWYWYPGWYWPYFKSSDYYYGWYPYYPGWGGGYISSYTVGTLLMHMHDMKDSQANNDSIPVVWQAAVNGLLSGNVANTQERLQFNIDKAFENSPYLDHTDK
ncbi:MAG: DUF4136 domain-containing protein [Bacteroidales bacterium]